MESLKLGSLFFKALNGSLLLVGISLNISAPYCPETTLPSLPTILCTSKPFKGPVERVELSTAKNHQEIIGSHHPVSMLQTHVSIFPVKNILQNPFSFLQNSTSKHTACKKQACYYRG